VDRAHCAGAAPGPAAMRSNTFALIGLRLSIGALQTIFWVSPFSFVSVVFD
jgi:hypothetical protein